MVKALTSGSTRDLIWEIVIGDKLPICRKGLLA